MRTIWNIDNVVLIGHNYQQLKNMFSEPTYNQNNSWLSIIWNPDCPPFENPDGPSYIFIIVPHIFQVFPTPKSYLEIVWQENVE